MELHKIRIEPGENVWNHKVFIDDMLMLGVTRVMLDLRIEAWPTVEIEFEQRDGARVELGMVVESVAVDGLPFAIVGE